MKRGIGATGDNRLQPGGMAADLDEIRGGIVDIVFSQDQPYQLVGQRARAGRGERLAIEISDRRAFAFGKNEAVVADRLPGIDYYDLGAGLNRGQHIDAADPGDIDIAGDQCAHGIGVAGDVDLLNLEIAKEALFLRDVERQRERRCRSWKSKFDFCRGCGGELAG